MVRLHGFADPREMQDSDEFLRLLLDFLDGELRAAATGVPLHKALMMQAMPKKLDQWPSRPFPQAGVVDKAAPVQGSYQQTNAQSESPESHGIFARRPSVCDPSPDGAPPGFADLPTLFSVFFEGEPLSC